jgi:hypothetical protein
VARSNNGLKLTARGASVEARQLNPVFGGRGGAVAPQNGEFAG